MIYCRTLGSFQITVDGQPAPQQLTWRKHLALLVYLGRSPRLRRSRDHLIAMFWPEKEETAARHSLNEAIRVIRRAGGDDALISEAGQIRLAESAMSLDVAALADAVAARDWTAAADLVHGEFLEGFSIPEASDFEDWLNAERQHWKRVSRESLFERGDELLRHGRVDEATGIAERAWQLDPEAENVAGLMMRALALAGDREGALQRYALFADRLATEQGTAPGAELQSVVRRIRDQRVYRRAQPSGDEPRDSRPAPMAGRGRQLGELVAQWQQSHEGVARAALVLGDAGLGKSRLIEELARRAELDGASIARARAVESDREDSWMGLRTLLRGGIIDFPGTAGAPGEAHASLGHLAGEWLERFPGVGAGRDMPVAQAFTEAIRVAADERPLLLVADDAQWFDRESLLALEAVLRDLKRSRLMLVIAAAHQPPRVELESLAERIGREIPGGVFNLEPLGPDELGELARWWLPRFTTLEIDRVARRVAADSAGIPLLAVELLRAVALGMDIQKLASWPQPDRTLDHTLPADLPPSVVAAIRVAFRRLNGPAQTVLATASALPEPVLPSLLARATGLSRDEINDSLDTLEWYRWLAAESRGYSFVARIVREMIARDMLTEGQRRRIGALAPNADG
jgi:DNA-binding SARP family transcriptional activator